MATRSATEPRRSNGEQNKNIVSQLTASNLIALIMWRGGEPMEQGVTAQQLIFQGINQTLLKRGYHAVFLDLGERIGTEDENAAREADHLRYTLDHGFGGVIFYPYAYRHNHGLIDDVSQRVPLVLLDRKIPGIETDFVGVNNYDAFARLTRHLIDLGHRRIALAMRFEPIHPVQERILAFVDTMQSIDLPGMAETILDVPPYQDDRAWAVVDAVFRQEPDLRPTAVACTNDHLALSVASRLQHLGLSIPKDVAVAGFDNIIPTLHNGVGLTTVAQPYEGIGIAAVDLLMRRIEDRSVPTRSMQLPAQLVVRSSTVA
jgi:LacI family transcriptional regulator